MAQHSHDAGRGTQFAFPQVAVQHPDVKEAVDEMREQAEEWIVEWEDGTSRTTTIVGLAWYAREHDPEATVRPVDG